MSRKEQITYFEVLKRYERKFEPKELDFYKMLVIRHKDEEELDKLSMEKLKFLHEKYHVNREKKNYDYLFKKPEEKLDTN
jgi:hypothetical protein